MAANVLHRIIGARLPAAARWPLATIGFNLAALSVFATFFGPWLVGELGASAGQAATAYLIAGLAGIAGGYLGGRLTDAFGARPVARGGSGAQVVLASVLLVPGIGIGVASVVLVVMTFLQPLRGVAQRIAVADAGPERERENLFAAYRLVVNLGSITGPALGAGMVGIGWAALHGEIVVLYLLSAVCSRGLPAGHRSGTPERPSVLIMLGDWRLYTLMFASTTAWTMVYTYEVVLPVALTQSYGLSPSAWGLVYALGPAIVVLFQLRVTRWLSGLPARHRLAVGTVLMGAAFLLVVAGAKLWLVLLLVVVFVAGDMLWGPASEVATLRIAPPRQRGAYVGMLTSTIWLGSAIAPGVGLPLRERFGDTALWSAMLVLGLVSGAAYLVTDVVAARPASRENSE